MSDKFPSCPNCGYVPTSFFASHMDVYKCKECGQKYCYQCPGTNGGKECPRCSSKEKTTVGYVYVK